MSWQDGEQYFEDVITAQKQGQDFVFQKLKDYIEEVKSYGDEIEVDTLYDDFRLYVETIQKIDRRFN